MNQSIKTLLKSNFIIPRGKTEKKYHFTYKEVERCVPSDSVKAYNAIVKGFLTRKYGRKWRKNEFAFRF